MHDTQAPYSETVQSSLPLSSPLLPFLQPALCPEEWLLLPALSRLPCLLTSGCVCPKGSTNRGSENWRRERSGCYFSWLPPEGLQLWWYILTLLVTASVTWPLSYSYDSFQVLLTALFLLFQDSENWIAPSISVPTGSLKLYPHICKKVLSLNFLQVPLNVPAISCQNPDTGS